MRAGLLAAAAAAGLAAMGQAHAQQPLSAAEVESFFEKSAQDVTRAMQSGDYGRAIEWIESALAADANFLVSLDLVAGDAPKGFAVVSLDKQDMLRLGRLALGLMSDNPEAVRNYLLEMKAVDVRPIGPDAAQVTTRIVESGEFAPAAGHGAQGSRPARFEVTADCRHLVERVGDPGRLVIGMSSCQARSRF